MLIGFYTDNYDNNFIGLPTPNYFKLYKDGKRARLIYTIADYHHNDHDKTIDYLTDIMNILLFTNDKIIGFINASKISLKDYEHISDTLYYISDFDNLISKTVKSEYNSANFKIKTKMAELTQNKDFINMLWKIVCYYGVFLSRSNRISKNNCNKIVSFVVYKLRQSKYNINNKKYIEDTKANLYNYASAHRERLKEKDKLAKRRRRGRVS
jgi:hypothetical protein